jgi:hypothetical protein
MKIFPVLSNNKKDARKHIWSIINMISIHKDGTNGPICPAIT